MGGTETREGTYPLATGQWAVSSFSPIGHLGIWPGGPGGGAGGSGAGPGGGPDSGDWGLGPCMLGIDDGRFDRAHISACVELALDGRPRDTLSIDLHDDHSTVDHSSLDVSRSEALLSLARAS